MAYLYSHDQYFRSVEICKDVTVFDIKEYCFSGQLKNEEPHRVFVSSTRVTSDVWSGDQQLSTFRIALKYIRNLRKLQTTI